MAGFWNSNSISTLFGTGSGSNSGSNLYSLFTDRASIRNGSYGKLLKSYYSTAAGSETTKSSSAASKSSSDMLDKILDSKKNVSVSKEAAQANAQIGQKLTNLQSSVSTLQKDDLYKDTQGGSTAKDKVSSAVKNFVDDYNALVKTSKDSTLVNKTSNVAGMMRSTATNADKLSEIGINLNADGTVSLDEKKLKDADISKVQELFSTDNIVGYGSTLASRAKFAGASGTTSTVAETAAAQQTTQTSAAALKEGSRTLASDALYAFKKDADGNETNQYDVEKILSEVKNFADNYNKLLDAAKDSTNSGVSANMSHIQDTTEHNKDALGSLGIRVGSDGKMTVDENTFQNTDMAAVRNLFRDYGSSVATSASLVNYYMSTQADASNGYTSSAAYNVQADSTYTTTM